MANADTTLDEVPVKKGKAGLLIGLILALAAGGGGFFAAFSGMGPFGSNQDISAEVSEEDVLKEIGGTAFVALDPIIVNIRSSSKYQLLRFVGQLEVKPEHASDIEQLKPRLMDVMNTYLNALEAARFEDPIALIKLRSQILRRIQIITGNGRVEDLLIMEFILQ